MRRLPFLLASAALCGIAALSSPAQAQTVQLTAGEVRQILEQAATKADSIDRDAVIAVTDRDGFVLGLWTLSDRVPTVLPVFPNPLPNPLPAAAFPLLRQYSLVAGAISRASTAAFLSSNQNAFTTRTAGFIIQQHFPPGIRNSGNGPLVGVGFSSLFYSDTNRVKLIPPGFQGAAPVPPTLSPGVRAPAFPLTSLSDSPGGVPLYKGGILVGGVGVTGDGSPTDLTPAGAIIFKETQKNATTGFKTARDLDEDVALAGQTGFRPNDEILATNVLINGIRIPYVFDRQDQIEDVKDVQPLGTYGHRIDVPLSATTVATGNPQASPAQYPYQVRELGGVEGLVRFPFRNDPVTSIPGRQQVFGADRLTAREVESIISKAANRANNTRAGIRLPIGTSSKNFIAVVNNPNKPGEAPAILGVFQTGEATIFSWDVAVQKARTALFFSNRQLAMSTRSVGFLSQRFFPPGIDGRPAGPLFGFQEAISLRRSPLGQFPGNPNLPNGETIFPGGFPLYRNGQLIGAIGVSGDGVDQDDLIAVSGCEDFLPNPRRRADTYAYRGARLPYAKFPRDPEQ